ncbi:hypothetical protein [Nicoliella lavandulae]|uniref:Uncharacterized protein n=1 Tax=Nicoliella lavandulae TaxID=3082954 RepID=A0ABU8SIP9_9LACO
MVAQNPDQQGFFEEIERLKADLARVNSLYPDDPQTAAEEIRKIWESK